MKLKVCGMKYYNNINDVAVLQPDYIGFVFYEKSSRYFEGQMPLIPDNIKKVGVFVNETLDKVIEKVIEYKLQVIQLHGEESPEYCKKLQSETIEIIKVFSIKDNFNFDQLTPYQTVCDYYLFDTKGKLPGGNGHPFNWEVLKNYTSTKPYFLSGGIGLSDLINLKAFFKTEASKQCHAIDINSKFEIKPGMKNIKKLNEFKTQLCTII